MSSTAREGSGSPARPLDVVDDPLRSSSTVTADSQAYGYGS
ncbi:hypothetical protein NKH77_42335 [Streptomyces sp. M19]